MLLRLATKRLGSTPANAEAAIFAISDLDRHERLMAATGWDDLLATEGEVNYGCIK